MLLCGERVRLGVLTHEDAPVIAGWEDDTDFLRLVDASPARPRTVEEVIRWMDSLHKSSTDFVFGIRLLADDALIGWIALDGILWSQQVGGLAVGIGRRDARGKGYGAEALRLLLDFAFDELNLHRVQLTVFAYNQRAIRLYERLGFQHEGTYREFLQRGGQRHHMLLYGLLRHEWEATAQAKGKT